MAVGDAHVFPGLLTPVLTQLSFKSLRLLFSHASEVRGKNKPERKFASNGYRAQIYQVMSQTRSPLSYTGGPLISSEELSQRRNGVAEAARLSMTPAESVMTDENRG